MLPRADAGLDEERAEALECQDRSPASAGSGRPPRCRTRAGDISRARTTVVASASTSATIRDHAHPARARERARSPGPHGRVGLRNRTALGYRAGYAADSSAERPVAARAHSFRGHLRRSDNGPWQPTLAPAHTGRRPGGPEDRFLVRRHRSRRRVASWLRSTRSPRRRHWRTSGTRASRMSANRPPRLARRRRARHIAVAARGRGCAAGRREPK